MDAQEKYALFILWQHNPWHMSLYLSLNSIAFLTYSIAIVMQSIGKEDDFNCLSLVVLPECCFFHHL